MSGSVFDPTSQIGNTDLKIIASLERLSEGFRVLLWEKAKVLGISPIQIQILIFVQFHPTEKCKVSYLAQEFNLTKATISEAVKSLEQKGFVQRQLEPADTRSHTLHLTEAGRSMVEQTVHFADPMVQALSAYSPENKGILLEHLLGVIGHLQRAGIVSVQRMCFSCRFYAKDGNGHFCNFINKPLKKNDLRIDCGEFEPKP